MDISNEKFLEEFAREIKDLAQQNMTITLRLAPGDAMVLIGAIQLACRHPSLTGVSRQVARRIVDRMQSDFLQYRVRHVLEVIRCGWEPQYDEPGSKT